MSLVLLKIVLTQHILGRWKTALPHLQGPHDNVSNSSTPSTAEAATLLILHHVNAPQNLSALLCIFLGSARLHSNMRGFRASPSSNRIRNLLHLVELHSTNRLALCLQLSVINSS